MFFSDSPILATAIVGFGSSEIEDIVVHNAISIHLKDYASTLASSYFTSGGRVTWKQASEDFRLVARRDYWMPAQKGLPGADLKIF